MYNIGSNQNTKYERQSQNLQNVPKKLDFSSQNFEILIILFLHNDKPFFCIYFLLVEANLIIVRI